MEKASPLEYSPSEDVPLAAGTTYRLVSYGPNPLITLCPTCNQHVTSTVKTEISAKTHLLAALLCLISCCCIPYLLDSCKNKNHYCPSCDAYLGTYIN